MLVEINSPVVDGTYSTFTITPEGRIIAIGIIGTNGFEDLIPSTTSTLSFDNGTRTLTITPITLYAFWSGGNRFVKTTPDTKQITDVEGLWFFYFDDTGVLQTTNVFDIDLILLYAWVAVVYWDADNNAQIRFGEERHGNLIPSVLHRYLHNTIGTQYGSGLALGNFVLDGSGDVATHAQFSVANGTIWDEDLLHTITDGSPQDISPIARLPIFYRIGASGVWRKFAANDFPIIYGGRGSPATGTRANWNQLTGGSWQLTEVAQLEYMLMHMYATNDLVEPIIAICGQATYGTLAAARTGANNEIHNLSLGGLQDLSLEFVRLGTVIWQTSSGYANTAKSRTRTLEDGSSYVDWRRYV